MLKRILRYIIAVIFIVSGFVKAVDVKGFSFKLEEYFAPDVFNMPFLAKYSLEIAVFVVALELLLGLMLLLKIKLKNTLASLIALCVFFAFLTFYSAYFNKVTDCGCFGDAIKFTPWQSFYKDIALSFGLIVLWLLNKKSNTLNNEKGCLKLPVFWLGILASAYIIYHGIAHEPLIDFRAYKIGTDLNAERQKINANPSVYKTYYTLKNSKTGEEKEVNQDDYVNIKEYWEEGTPWKIVEGKSVSKLEKEGYVSEISKFKIEDANGNEVTEEILKAPKVILLCSYQPQEADKDLLAKAENKLKGEKNTKVFGISTHQDTFKGINNMMMDGTAMKTIARSNPFILVLQNGKIVEKQSAKDFLEK